MKRAAALALLLCTAAAPDNKRPKRLDYLGINLSGAEFGVPDEFRRPYPTGAAGTDYIFPTRADIDSTAAAGFNIGRLPFAWERLQPTPKRTTRCSSAKRTGKRSPPSYPVLLPPPLPGEGRGEGAILLEHDPRPSPHRRSKLRPKLLRQHRIGPPGLALRRRSRHRPPGIPTLPDVQQQRDLP